jgi:hypothetical protein
MWVMVTNFTMKSDWLSLLLRESLSAKEARSPRKVSNVVDSGVSKSDFGCSSLPSWVRTTRRRLSSSPASRKPAAPCVPGGAAVWQPASARPRSGRYASSRCSSR